MIILRPALAEDVMVILSMRKEFYSIDQYPFDEEEQARMTSDFILHPSTGILYIILKESKSIGYVCLTYGYSFEYGGKIAFVDELFLVSDQRDKGIGSQVMDFIITKAKELKLATLHLEAETHNDKANRLYSKKGFKNTNRFLLFNKLNTL